MSESASFSQAGPVLNGGLSIRHSILIALGLICLAIVVLLTIGGVTARGNQTNAWVDHIGDVILNATRCLEAFSKADTEQRRFALTGDKQYLLSYGQAESAILAGIAMLRSLTADNPRQQLRIGSLTSLTNRKLTFFRETIRLRQESGEHSAALALRLDSGVNQMNSVYSVLSEINLEENSLLAGRIHRRRESLNWLSLLSAGGAILGLALVLIGLGRTEGNLSQSENQFHMLADGIPQFCWIANADGWIFWYNRRWYDYTGTTPEQMTGWGWRSVHDPEALPLVIERWTASIRTGVPFEMVFPLRGKDGVFRPFLTQVRPVTDRSGKIVRWFGTNTEIGEQHRVEKALRESEERLQLAQHAARVGTFDWDIRTGIHRWTAEMASMYGLEASEFITTRQGWKSRVHPSDREGVTERVRMSLENGQLEGEWRVVWPDQSVHWLYGRGSVIKDDAGQPVRMIGVNIDITERKRAEEALRETEARYRTLAEALPAIIFTTTVENETDYVNGRWQEYTGLSPEQSRAVGFDDPIHPQDRAAVQERWQEARKNQAPYQTEFRLRRSDGVYRWFRCTATPLRDKQGNVSMWLGISSDSDDEKRSEERARQAQKMEAIGRLAGGVAHDFNNVLTAICGYNSMLLDRLQSQPVLAGYALEVNNAAERAAALTSQLLTFSRRENPQAKLLNINRAVLNMRNLLGRLIGEDIEIRTNLAIGLGSVRADPVRLDQVIMNLAVNARDAMPRGGRLTFETANVTVNAVNDTNTPPGDYISLLVSDTGCGMDAETRRHLFEPFFTTKVQGKGTGLGLSIVYGVMQQNGGSIAVESQPGEGTTFRLYLPRCPDALPEEDEGTTPAVVAALPVVIRDTTVLLVEDDKVVLQFVSAVLRRKGYQVLDAGTPAQAIGIAKANPGPLHLLLSDVLMPGMRGPELATRLREIQPLMSVLYMSGYSDSTFLDRSTLEGAVFLQKPFTEEELLRVVGETLARSPLLS